MNKPSAAHGRYNPEAAWLVRDPDRLGTSLAGYAGHPAYGTAQLSRTWTGSPSCSAATASPCPA